MDTKWIKTAAAQVRTTIKQAINKVDRIGDGRAERSAPQALDDVLVAKPAPKPKEPGAGRAAPSASPPSRGSTSSSSTKR